MPSRHEQRPTCGAAPAHSQVSLPVEFLWCDSEIVTLFILLNELRQLPDVSVSRESQNHLVGQISIGRLRYSARLRNKVTIATNVIIFTLQRYFYPQYIQNRFDKFLFRLHFVPIFEINQYQEYAKQGSPVHWHPMTTFFKHLVMSILYASSFTGNAGQQDFLTQMEAQWECC